jgi:transcriptional regulator with XRE-family HTH domain
MAKSPSNTLRREYARADFPGGFVRGRYAKRRIEVSVGESVRIIRGLQGLSQSELAKVTRIPRTSISAIENNRLPLGIDRAKVLARALKCHPAVLVPTDQEVTQSRATPTVVDLPKKRRRQTLVALVQVDDRRLVAHREVEAWAQALTGAKKPKSSARRRD